MSGGGGKPRSSRLVWVLSELVSSPPKSTVLNSKNHTIIGYSPSPSSAPLSHHISGLRSVSSSVAILAEQEKSKVGKKTEKSVPMDSKGSKAEAKKKITKKNRVWDDSKESAPESKLDFTDSMGEDGENSVEAVAADHGESMMDKEEEYSSDSEAEEEEEVGSKSKPDSKKKGWFSSIFERS